MAKFRLRDRLRYRFDATLSRGATGLIFWLFVLAGIIALISATIITFSHTAPAGPGGVRPGFSLLVWQAWQRTLNLTVGYGPLPYIIGTFIPTLGSLFIGGIFIGLLTGGIQTKIRNLRKGRSLVVEENHTVILGWSQQIFQVISEIAQANANKADAWSDPAVLESCTKIQDLVKANGFIKGFSSIAADTNADQALLYRLTGDRNPQPGGPPEVTHGGKKGNPRATDTQTL